MQYFYPNSTFRILVLCLVALLAAARASAQQPFAREYWLNDASTPVRINALAQDKYGYIWIGTDAGLYRFNGTSFVSLQDSVHAPVTALGVASNTVWVGFKNGAIGTAENDSISLLHKPGTAEKAITSIHPISAGTAIATSEDQLISVSPGSVRYTKQQKSLPNSYLYTVIPRNPYQALLASDDGLTHLSFEGNGWNATSISTTQGLPDAILRVIKPLPGTTHYWLGTQQGGIALYNGETKACWVPFYAGNWNWGQVNDILPIDNRCAYAATDAGYLLELYLADSLHLTITPHYYPGKELVKLLADKTGNLWCATSENLLKISAPYAGYIPLEKPYVLQQITAMACDQKNGLWLAEDNLLYLHKLEDTGQHPQLVAQVPSGITSLYVDGTNRLWVGTLGHGLWYLPASGNTLVSAGIDQLKNENILSIAGTATDLWVASLSGVHEISYPDASGAQRVLRHHTKASGIGTDYVYQIYTDSKGRIWMATDGAGVTMYDGSYHRWDSDKAVKVAYAITEDAEGNIWAATLEKGLYRYRAGSWKRYGREEGLQETAITSLSATKSGMVIAINRQGIDQWYPGSSQFRHYNRRLGIDIDSTSPVLNCITRDTAGNVYVPFEHGIIKLNNYAARFNIRPVVRIAQIDLFAAPVSIDQHRFGSDENYLSFSFDGLNYANPEPFNYRYKLDGYNSNWIITGDNRVTFPLLPPGDYTFRLQGSLNTHFTPDGEATYSFHIAQPLWKRLWFILLCIVLLTVLAWYLVRMRDKSVNNLLRLRQERLSFEYEHLKSQVNPHFLFNSLNTLTGLIEDGEKNAATTYTVQLSDLYRNMLTYRDRDLISLAEEWGILSAYLHIQRCRFEDAFDVRVDIPEVLMKTKKIVPMSLQLLVENAIKHNVASKSSPLVIQISADEDSITVTNPLQPKLSPQKGAGIGLGHIKRRYELLTNRKISFGPNNGLYIVSLPLL